MSLIKKIAGIATGVSTVAVIGVAIAQGVPPNPMIRNPALGAGQQSPQLTPMGETGVLAPYGEVPVATLTKQAEPVAAAPAPAEPVAAAPEPAPAPVAAAPEAAPAPEPAQTMGAAPEPQQPMHAPRADRN
ncbi:MAG TPA: hypothetical protein VKD22_13920 [Ramlibacter sp.]|nr:hypothetical protein [Ramlibacter sp.]